MEIRFEGVEGASQGKRETFKEHRPSRRGVYLRKIKIA